MWVMRPGRGDITISLVPMNSASSTLWVMKKTDLRVLVPDLQDQLLRLFAGQRVQRAERFVHQQDLRVAGQRAGNAHALLHAARQLVDRRFLEAVKPQKPDEFVRDLIAFGFRPMP